MLISKTELQTRQADARLSAPFASVREQRPHPRVPSCVRVFQMLSAARDCDEIRSFRANLCNYTGADVSA
jgi:hypothetical protein